MATPKTFPATDSPSDLRPLVGDDATAEFENDPTFTDSNPGAGGSSENSLQARDTDDLDEEEEDDEDDDDLEDDEDDEDEDDLDEEDDEDDLEDEDEEDDDFDDEEDDEEDEEEEEGAARLHLVARATEADDDAGDVQAGVNEEEFTEDDMDTDRVALPLAA